MRTLLLGFLHISQTNINVSFKNHASCRLPVDSGVPQGSVLGPHLFLVLNNDIIDIPVKIRLYADDCVMYSEIDGVSDQLTK